MKRKIIIFLIVVSILVVFSVIVVLPEQKYDFEKINWGMSKEEVKKAVKDKFIEENRGEDDLQYKGKVGGLDCYIGYFFEEGKLISAGYTIIQSSTNKDDYINDYKKLKEYFIKKYGKPAKDRPYSTSWDTPTTEIRLFLSEVNNEFDLLIYCKSKELKEWADEIKEKEDIALKQSKQQYDFRKTNWGMGKEQIKATEDKRPYLEDDNRLVYKVKIGVDDFLCVYSFIEDKFYQSTYIFNREHINKNLYINDYERLKEILIKKYGKPTIDKIEWRNDLFKNNKQDWGTAISIGHLEYRALWMMLIRLDIIEITLKLTGDNYEIVLGILYESEKWGKWADKIKQEKSLEEF